MTLFTAYSVGVLATSAVAMAFWLGYLAWKRSTALLATLQHRQSRTGARYNSARQSIDLAQAEARIYGIDGDSRIPAISAIRTNAERLPAPIFVITLAR